MLGTSSLLLDYNEFQPWSPVMQNESRLLCGVFVGGWWGSTTRLKSWFRPLETKVQVIKHKPGTANPHTMDISAADPRPRWVRLCGEILSGMPSHFAD
jgi:hypothetical protein